jgi:hypothetical protein
VKRYHAFGMMYWEPDGGMFDYIGSYHTLDEARAAIKQQRENGDLDWGHIAETQEDGSLKTVVVLSCRDGNDHSRPRRVPK